MAEKKEVGTLDRNKLYIKPIKLATLLEQRPQQIFQQIRNGSLPSVRDEEGRQALYVADVVNYLKGRKAKLELQLSKIDNFILTMESEYPNLEIEETA